MKQKIVQIAVLKGRNKEDLRMFALSDKGRVYSSYYGELHCGVGDWDEWEEVELAELPEIADEQEIPSRED